MMARPPDPLEPAGDRSGRFYLDYKVNSAHIDAQLERAGRHDAGEPALLQRLLYQLALLPSQRAVVRSHELLAGDLVDAARETFRQAAAVDEHDRAAMCTYQLDESRVDGRPDAEALDGAGRWTTGGLLQRDRLAEPGHVLHRDHDLQFQGLADAGIDDDDRTRRCWLRLVLRHSRRPAIGRQRQRAVQRTLPEASLLRQAAAEEGGDRLERTLGGRQPDPLGRRGD